MGHLWIQTDHNQDHKCPDYGQPEIIHVYYPQCGQLEVLFIMTEHDQPVFVWEVNPGYCLNESQVTGKGQ